MISRDFPDGPVIETSPSNAGDTGSMPGLGPRIRHALRPKNQKINNGSNILTNPIKTLKKVHIKNIFTKEPMCVCVCVCVCV